MPNFKVTNYPHGTFSWAEVGTTDKAATAAFFSKLLGWEVAEFPIPGGSVYTMFMLDGSSAAAAYELMPEQLEQGIPPHWDSYVSVNDVDVMAEKIKAAGGTIIVEPMDVMDQGRMLVFQDPQGATLSLWQPQKHIGAGVVNTAGAMGWNELMTRDIEGAKKFYSDVFGWTFENSESGYITFKNNGRMNGGMLQMDESYGDMPPAWGVYFTVNDLDAALEKVTELGGKVIMPKTYIADADGHFGIIADPAGAVCTLIQIEVEPWEE